MKKKGKQWLAGMMAAVILMSSQGFAGQPQNQYAVEARETSETAAEKLEVKSQLRTEAAANGITGSQSGENASNAAGYDSGTEAVGKTEYQPKLKEAPEPERPAVLGSPEEQISQSGAGGSGSQQGTDTAGNQSGQAVRAANQEQIRQEISPMQLLQAVNQVRIRQEISPTRSIQAVNQVQIRQEISLMQSIQAVNQVRIRQEVGLIQSIQAVSQEQTQQEISPKQLLQKVSPDQKSRTASLCRRMQERQISSRRRSLQREENLQKEQKLRKERKPQKEQKRQKAQKP